MKQGRRFAADTARIADENARGGDCKHTSGEGFVATDSDLGGVVDTEEGAVTSILGNEGRIAQAWENVRRGLRVFCVVFLALRRTDTEELALMEAVVKQVRTTRHPWLVTCDANMDPAGFRKALWFEEWCMLIEAPEAVISSCVIASKSFQGKIENMEVVEDFESRLHKAVTLLVDRDKEIQEVLELKMPKPCKLTAVESSRKKQGGWRKRRTGGGR